MSYENRVDLDISNEKAWEIFSAIVGEIHYLPTTLITLTVCIFLIVVVNSGSYETWQLPIINFMCVIEVSSYVKCESRLITGSKDDSSISMYYKLRNCVLNC